MCHETFQGFIVDCSKCQKITSRIMSQARRDASGHITFGMHALSCLVMSWTVQLHKVLSTVELHEGPIMGIKTAIVKECYLLGGGKLLTTPTEEQNGQP